MSSFILNSVDDERKVIEFTKKTSYTFSPKTKKGTFTTLKTVNVYDDKRVQKIIINKYKIKYARLINIIKSILDNDDTTEGDIMICLDEISKMQSMLLIKYQELLNRKTYEYFLNDLYFLQQVMKDKLYELQKEEVLQGGSR